MKWLLCCAAVLSALARAQEAPLHITVRPNPAYIETSRGAQLVNCDFVVENASAEKWVLLKSKYRPMTPLAGWKSGSL